MHFEVIAEGKAITPPWLIEQAIVKDYVAVLHRSVDLLLKANERLYGAWYKTSVGAKHPWAAAAVLNRQGEYVVKLQSHFNKIAANEGEYEAAKVLPDMLGWPARQADPFRERIREIEREYEITVAREAQNLVGNERPSHVPDFAGQFLSRTAQTVLEAISRNDVPMFRPVFPWFFEASLKKVAVLLPSGEARSEIEQIQRFNVAMGPLLDLVELSGYSIVVSELHQSSELWDAVRDLWDQWLMARNAGATRRQLLRGALQTADVPMMVAPGEVLRTRWRMRVHNLLRNIPVEHVALGSAHFGIHGGHRVRHASALIRVLAGQTFPGFYRGIDVFVAMYFAGLPGNEAAAREIRSSGLIDALRRESRKGAREEGGGGGEKA